MESEVVAIIDARENWIDETIDYIRDKKLPEDHNLAKNLIHNSPRYAVISGKLYLYSYSKPHTLCVTPKTGLQILDDIYSGVYGNHARGWSLAQKALNASYYWPDNATDNFSK